MTLHIVNQSPFAGNALQDCLSTAIDGDRLLLIEDAVYAAHDPALAQRMSGAVYCLKSDAIARGVSVDPAIQTVDEAQWVNLCTQNNPIVSWFR
ncbi:sulfurtransferase complex subunit TusB [Microbulbifer sp. CAU 1566]|uniref:sulfurtransferase complex subunit TusB n=1 Tax=Microbulbifer sp. CAU 1566 TaxID=2933269 RepID=UPI00200691C2|nr:sulfurtransferase complex subunit TusB [Microbulbifer sp. CAU 1566]MCK7596919.1 sulfurtransferase complex subunit TusB [Microbulbifer sp. CAU 1566]